MSVRSPAAAPRIVILPSAVADQIAAGEVVERPASAVKELLENALDAGATRVDIEIEDGGLAGIRVSDDGCGMASSDARLAVERHATSKILSVADLVGVATFGFRGEALPSIASVSHFELISAPNAGAGTRLRIAGGQLDSQEEVVRKRGTTVVVRDLFYNVPARRKFLRSARSEWRSIMEVVTAAALARRDVQFTVAHQGKVVMDLPPASSLRARVAALWGARASDRFVDVSDIHGAMLVSGLTERPADAGTATRRTALIVNGRPVRDGGLVRAAEAAYRSVLPPGVRPSLVLDLTLPGDLVDVNVHPAKAEVRFRDRWQVERLVEGAIRRALGTEDSTARFTTWRAGAAEAAVPPNETVWPQRAPAVPSEEDVTPGLLDERTESPREPVPRAPDVAQLRRTYLMFEDEAGVIFVDQHSAHERVLYERLLRALEAGALPSQRLLFAETLHLSPAELEAFDENRDAFGRLGFEIAEFGGTSIVVHSVPLLHPRFDALRCLRDTLAGLTGDRTPSAHGRHERLIATLACRAAIKAGDQLQPDERRALLADLSRVTLAAHDVHGRSAIVQLSWAELERRFGRR